MFTNASFGLFLCNYNSNTTTTNKYVSKQKNDNHYPIIHDFLVES